MPKAFSAALALSFALSGCGVLYTGPRVASERTETSALGVGVEVVPMTIETLATANAEAYQPRSLPSAFAAPAEETIAPPHLPRTALGARGVAALDLPLAPPEILRPDSAASTRRLPPPLDPEPYRIGPSDVLSVAFAASSDLPGSGVTAVRVQETGAVVIPEIGIVQVDGLTLDEVQSEMLEQLARRRLDREVSVDVTGFNSQKVAISGAVRSPSVKPITFAGLTLDQAIASAGGLDRVDARYGVILLNRDGETYRIPVQEFISEISVAQTRLKDGDNVFVDRRFDAEEARLFFEAQVAQRSAQLTERQIAAEDARIEADRRNQGYQNRLASRVDARAARAEAREAFRARLELGAEARDYVYVAGEVRRQQRLGMPYDGRFTLADVLFQAEGVDPVTGDPSEIYVIRRPLAGGGAEDRLTAFHLDAGNAAYLALATLFEMRPSDVVFVEAQPITEWNRVVTQALPFLTAADTGIGIGKD